MSTVHDILERSLRHDAALLSEMDSPLAKEAEHWVRRALLNVSVLRRLHTHSAHILGDRPDPADDEARRGVAW